MYGNIVFYNIAQEWPKLIKYWQKTEEIFLNKPYFIKGWKLVYRVRILAAVYLGVAFGMNNLLYLLPYYFHIKRKKKKIVFPVEHIMSNATNYYANYKEIEFCHLNVNIIEKVYTKERIHIYAYIPYSHFIMVPFEV